jgi:hypothetical protein
LKIVAADWQNGRLILELNRVPEQEWTQRFLQPRGSWSSIMGSGPEAFQFIGNKANVSASEGTAQQILDHAKSYVAMANNAYEEDLRQIAIKEERTHLQRLAEERTLAEQRARVLGTLKI